MFCKHCGKELPDEPTPNFCTYCGGSLQEKSVAPEFDEPTTPQPSTEPKATPSYYFNPNVEPSRPSEPEVAANAFPMKWFYFLIYFALWAGAVINILGGIGQIGGGTYGTAGGSAENVYAKFPTMQTVDVIVGLLTIALGAWQIFTRMQLAKFKKNAPLFLYSTYTAAIVVPLFYAILTSFVTNISFGYFLAETISSLLVNAVAFVLNIIYFKKRKSLFVK